MLWCPQCVGDLPIPQALLSKLCNNRIFVIGDTFQSAVSPGSTNVRQGPSTFARKRISVVQTLQVSWKVLSSIFQEFFSVSDSVPMNALNKIFVTRMPIFPQHSDDQVREWAMAFDSTKMTHPNPCVLKSVAVLHPICCLQCRQSSGIVFRPCLFLLQPVHKPAKPRQASGPPIGGIPIRRKQEWDVVMGVLISHAKADRDLIEKKRIFARLPGVT